MSGNLAYADELWDELVDGKTVLMSPRPAMNHVQTAGNIYRIFGNYLKGRTCRVFPDGVDLYLTDKDRFIPDVMVVCDRSRIKADGVYGAPELVVEVLSPSSVKRDRIYKKAVYEKCGVREYWIVNPLDKTIDVYHLKDGAYQLADICMIPPDYCLKKMSDQEKAEIKMEITPSIFSGFTIALSDIFEDVP